MAYQRVPETAEIRLIFEVALQEVSCVFHARMAGGYSQTALQNLADTIGPNDGPAFAAIMSLQDHYLRCEVRGLDAENDYFVTSVLGAIAGSVAIADVPNNVSFCITQRSAYTGRSARGRVYFPAVHRSALSTTADETNQVTSTWAAAAVGVVEGVRIDIENIGGWDAVIVSRYHNGAKRSEAVTYQWLTTENRTLNVATRRSRLR